MTISFAWLILSTASISRCLTTDHLERHHSESLAGGTLPRETSDGMPDEQHLLGQRVQRDRLGPNDSEENRSRRHASF